MVSSFCISTGYTVNPTAHRSHQLGLRAASKPVRGEVSPAPEAVVLDILHGRRDIGDEGEDAGREEEHGSHPAAAELVFNKLN